LLLRAAKLTKRFGGVRALLGVDIALEAGAVHSIIGPNGAGKSTLLNVLSGICRPDEGQIFLDERNLTGRASHEFAAAGIGRTFQNLQIFFNMSALENVMAGRWLHERCGLGAALLRLPVLARAEAKCRADAQALLELVGLARWVDAPAEAMPYGALKRLEIARALAAEPRLLLLDEPAAGLNPSETQDIGHLIRLLAGRGITVVLVEHDMKLVMGISNHVVVLDHGEKLAEGDAAAVSGNPSVIEAYLGVETC
jgi:branched-chain amino acid transport system ATP-binding protein